MRRKFAGTGKNGIGSGWRILPPNRPSRDRRRSARSCKHGRPRLVNTMTLLVDHNMKGQAILLWGTLAAAGWLDLLPMRLVTFEDVGLPVDCNDCLVWRFAQTLRLSGGPDVRSLLVPLPSKTSARNSTFASVAL